MLRYIRLTYLIPELLEMVDENKIAFNPAVEISYLEQSEQRVLLNAMELNDCTPAHAQAIRLKKLSQEGVLQDQTIYDILAEQKPNQQEQYRFKREDIRKYFPKNYTDKQAVSYTHLDVYKRQVHLIAKPSRREHLGLFSGSLCLRFLRFLDAGTDKVGALQQCVGIYLYFIGKAFTQFLVGIRRPNDILFC